VECLDRQRDVGFGLSVSPQIAPAWYKTSSFPALFSRLEYQQIVGLKSPRSPPAVHYSTLLRDNTPPALSPGPSAPDGARRRTGPSTLAAAGSSRSPRRRRLREKKSREKREGGRGWRPTRPRPRPRGWRPLESRSYPCAGGSGGQNLLCDCLPPPAIPQVPVELFFNRPRDVPLQNSAASTPRR